MFAVKGQINPPCVITDDAIGPQTNWQAIFGNDRPVQIEIGPGKAAVLMQLARLFPDHNFLGIEWASAFSRLAARRITHWQIDNIKILRTDAREFIIDRVGPDSVRAVHIYFPDPWPKKRHANRRLFIGDFCRALHRVLIPGGNALAATDHPDYAEQIRDTLLAVDGFAESDPHELAGTSLEHIESNYQAKFVKQGRSIFRIAVEKAVMQQAGNWETDHGHG